MISWCDEVLYGFRDRFACFLCKMWLKCLICVVLCLFVSVFLNTSVLSVLLCLEALVVVGVLVLVGHTELIFSVCFVSVGACESAVGLACLVSLVRAQGTSFMVV